MKTRYLVLSQDISKYSNGSNVHGEFLSYPEAWLKAMELIMEGEGNALYFVKQDRRP